MNSLIDKRQFVGLEECTWLYSGAETPTLKKCVEKVTEYMNYRSKGAAGREYNSRIENECKRNIGKLLSGEPEQIAFMSNSSEIISMIAQSLNLHAGDNVILNTLEFPSGILPWLLLKEKGIEVRLVSHENWQLSVESIMEKVDDRTKLVVTSHVSYLSGARLDYKNLYKKLLATNALLLLDVTQSLGAFPVEMNSADFVVCSSYKWLMSIHGVGILAVNPKRTEGFSPRYVGWRSISDMFSEQRFENFTFYPDARKFELGFPSYSTICTLNYTSSLILDIGKERIEHHILTLGAELIKQLKQKEYEIMTPERPEQRSGNICIVCPNGEDVSKQLEREQVYAWGGDGRLRASIHMFNDSKDIEHFVELLPEPAKTT